MQKDGSPIDLDKLRGLLRDVSKLELSSSNNIFKMSWPIYHFNEKGWGRHSKDIFIRTTNFKLIHEPAPQKLVDFLNTYVTPEVANNETEKYSLYYHLISILFDEFNKNQIKGAVENRKSDEPFDLNESQLQGVVESQVELCLYKLQKINKVNLISTWCPIEMHDVNELFFFQTENLNVKICKWDETERAVFASQNAYNTAYSSDDFGSKSPMNIETFLEIEYTFAHDKYDVTIDNKLQQFLFGIVDLVKWVVMVVDKNPYPIREGTCFLKTCNPSKNDTIQRDLNPCFVFEGDASNFIIKPDIVDKVRELTNDYCNTRNEFNDLEGALWFFGRACTANLQRDRLIDSVIGLEIILVQGHEQLGYQFRLHGATIFSTQWDENIISLFDGEKELFWKKEELVKWFSELYKERSSSVHGVNNEYTENDVLPALYALAVIIKGVVNLHKKGLLHDDDKHKISGAVGNYIIDKSVLKNID